MKLKIVAVAAAAVLSGCASTEVKQEVKKDYSSADQAMAQARAKLAMPEPIVLPVSPTPYFGKTSVAKVALKDELPLPLRSKTLVHFDTPFAYGPEQFANLITEETGVGVRVGKLGAVKTISLSSIPPMTWGGID
ncbi:hypothetical protein ACHMW6_00350 (plasmid) [Pseudoduganella sp. UC29_106]|uniref:hypothetical protein n=1 Tax=Pseudoduganella sp. UC29_106 TaxID=3374553 RepID=UPI003757F4F6